MNVLSLFDGMSCGREALNRLDIPVTNYYSSEIDKWAIKIAQKNWPTNQPIGDINLWTDWGIDFSKIDMVFAGFPCQAWSVAGNQKGKEDERGALAWVMMDIFDYIQYKNPEVKFLFENVRMKKDFLEEVNELIGVEPIFINSSLVSAQNRQRYYWHNLGDVEQPEDRGIYLKDILESSEEVGAIKSHGKWKLKYLKSQCLDANYFKGGDNHGQRTMITNDCKFVGAVGDKIQGDGTKSRDYRQGDRVYSPEGKATTLNATGGGKAGNTGLYLTENISDYVFKLASMSAKDRKVAVKTGDTDKPLVKELKEGQFIYNNHLGQNGTLAKDKAATLVTTGTPHVICKKYSYLTEVQLSKLVFKKVSDNDIKLIAHSKKFRTTYQVFHPKGKTECLNTAQGGGRSPYTIDKLGIRKLTPIECERLQTLPDNYTEGVSNSQRYKMLGNGWTVEVITHILKNLLTK